MQERKMSTCRTLPFVLLLLSAVAGVLSCRHSSGTAATEATSDSVISHPFPDTLRVGTLYSPTSYFIYRETEMGYDFDMVNKLASDKGIAVEWTIAHNLKQAVELLDSGEIDLLAYEIPITSEYRDNVVACGVENITHQVLVQPKTKVDSLRITDVTQLIGRDVYVEDGSKYMYRMLNLNDEVGGGINIIPVQRDTLIAEDLIAMVSQGDIPLTVVDSDIAALNKSYYPDLDITLEVGFPQRSAWGVAPDKAWLADSINRWSQQDAPRKQSARLLKRYYERSKTMSAGIFDMDFSNGRMSPYDFLFKKYAPEIGWDWRLLSAVAYAESRYDSTQVSWAGARGIMQLMPATAKAFGLSPDRMAENEASVATSIKVFRSLDTSLKHHVANPDERIKFILAAYNSGLAHILDAIAIAKKLGMKADVWDGSVAEALMLKSNPEYYNNPEICRYGYFRGRQTYDYVRTVSKCFEKAKKQIRP